MSASTDGPDPDPEADLQARAKALADNGWGPVPLPTGKKAQPPTGFTGQGAALPTFADWYGTFDGNRDAWGNLGARIPEGVVGVDVDAYKGKHGAQTWELLGGPGWPGTVILSARFLPGYDGVSGIRLYRLPDGVDQGDLWGAHDGIEILRYGHRYAVAPGSWNPDIESTYRVYDPSRRAFIDTLPPVGDLPELTVEQARLLTKAGAPWAVAGDSGTRREPDQNPMCEYTSSILNRALGDLSTSDSRYGTMSDAVYALVRGEEEGHHVGQALTVLRLAYYEATAADRKASGGENPLSEFDRNLSGARDKVAADPTWDGFKGCCGGQTEAVEPPTADQYQNTTPSVDGPDDDVEGWGDTSQETPKEDPAKRARRRAALEELRRIVARDDAQEMFNEIRLGTIKPLEAIPLPEFLNQQDEEENYRVGIGEDGGLWPSEGRVLLAAAAKTGKTTLVLNLIASLTSGDPFLGKYPVQAVTGTLVYLNMEVGPRTIRRWMRDIDIAGADKVAVVNLRGEAGTLTISSEQGRRKVAAWLRDLGAEIVILDPLVPLLAANGIDENGNADVARFFSWWSETMALAGVHDDLIVHHTGHAGDRSRGASRLLDEPDAIWTLTKDGASEEEEKTDLGDLFNIAPSRFLQAFGRDVELAPETLEFDPVTRLLTLTGESRGHAKERKRQETVMEQIRRIMADGEPRSKTAIAEKVRGMAKDLRADAVENYIISGHLYDTGQRYNKTYILYGWTENPAKNGDAK